MPSHADFVHLRVHTAYSLAEGAIKLKQLVKLCEKLAMPAVGICDTGNLDPHTADGVFQELVALVRGSGVAALIATHNPELASRMDRIVRLQDGLLV